MLIWTIEGEQYQVAVPDITMISTLIEHDEDELLEHVMLGINFVGGVHSLWGMQDGQKKQLHLSQWQEDPLHHYTNQYKGEIALYPMLIPFNKHGKSIANQMAKDNPDGTIIQAGFLYNNSVLVRSVKNPITTRYSMRDDGDGVPCEWMFCQGCLIAKKPWFYDTAENFWNVLYKPN